MKVHLLNHSCWGLAKVCDTLFLNAASHEDFNVWFEESMSKSSMRKQQGKCISEAMDSALNMVKSDKGAQKPVRHLQSTKAYYKPWMLLSQFSEFISTV